MANVIDKDGNFVFAEDAAPRAHSRSANSREGKRAADTKPSEYEQPWASSPAVATMAAVETVIDLALGL